VWHVTREEEKSRQELEPKVAKFSARGCLGGVIRNSPGPLPSPKFGDRQPAFGNRQLATSRLVLF
jgi:hypothetical protein